MPKSTDKSKPNHAVSPGRNSNTCYTAEAFREIAEEAFEELFDNSDTYEIKSLIGWGQDLKRALGRVADRGDVASATDSRLHGDAAE